MSDSFSTFSGRPKDERNSLVSLLGEPFSSSRTLLINVSSDYVQFEGELHGETFPQKSETSSNSFHHFYIVCP